MTATAPSSASPFALDADLTKYQADPSFLPDKEGTYHYEVSHDGWIKAHNALRGELTATQTALRATAQRNTTTAIQDWEVAALQRILAVHVEFVHEHHQTEDFMAPELAKRIQLPQDDTAGDMVEDHVQLVEMLENIETKVKNLKAGDDRANTIGPLADQWDEYVQEMTEHLRQEEITMVPLTRAYFSYKEYNQIFHKAHRRVKQTKLATGCFIYHMGPNVTRHEFMKEQHIPFFIWHLVFAGASKAYQTEIVEQSVVPLQTGEVPPHKRGMLSHHRHHAKQKGSNKQAELESDISGGQIPGLDAKQEPLNNGRAKLQSQISGGQIPGLDAKQEPSNNGRAKLQSQISDGQIPGQEDVAALESSQQMRSNTSQGQGLRHSGKGSNTSQGQGLGLRHSGRGSNTSNGQGLPLRNSQVAPVQ